MSRFECESVCVWIQECVKTFCWEIIPEMKGNVANDEILSCKVQDEDDFWSIGPVGHI